MASVSGQGHTQNQKYKTKSLFCSTDKSAFSCHETGNAAWQGNQGSAATNL
ncbi:hypothetical protein [Mesorhizobium sp. AA23]|uniref:hypothetical protein n=1 Tax=Mesorhizobium sp. AA23 TaxID=1854058 RepID=UPI0012EA488E|nr:hypothetical protein [Mesorhizobium sp. AA23]